MQSKFRLSRSEDFKRVRRIGKSYAHPLVVLFVFAKHPCGMASEAPGPALPALAGRPGSAVEVENIASMSNMAGKVLSENEPVTIGLSE